MNKLLQQQLQNFGGIDNVSENFSELIQEISRSYDQLEKDKELMAQSAEKISREMWSLNTELEIEKEYLAVTHNELNTLFTNLEEVVFSVRFPDSLLLQMSPACETIYGYPSQAFQDNPNLWKELIVKEDRGMVDAKYELLYLGESCIQHYRIRHISGAIRWVETKVTPTVDSDGKLIRVDGVTADITKRKEAEQKVERNEKYFRALVENVGDIICLTDKYGMIIYVSPAVEKVLGYSAIAVTQEQKLLSQVKSLPESSVLESQGFELWPASTGEEWTDEIGSHVFIGESQCR